MTQNYIAQIDGKWYAFAGDYKKGSVYSIGSDSPDEGSGNQRWIARWSESGIQYVASESPSRSAAVAKCKRAGGYNGEIESVVAGWIVTKNRRSIPL